MSSVDPIRAELDEIESEFTSSSASPVHHITLPVFAPPIAKMAANQFRMPLPPVLKTEDNVKHWRIKVDSYIDALGVEDEKKRRGILVQLLNDARMDWFQHQKDYNKINDQTSLKDIMDKLKKFFTPISIITQAKQELGQLAQTGTVKEYIACFIKTATKIPDMNDGEQH